MPPGGTTGRNKRKRRRKMWQPNAQQGNSERSDVSTDADSILRVTINNQPVTKKRQNRFKFRKYLNGLDKAEKELVLCSTVNEHASTSRKTRKKTRPLAPTGYFIDCGGQGADEEERVNVDVTMEEEPERRVEIAPKIFKDSVHMTEGSLNSKFTNLMMQDRTIAAERKTLKNRKRRQKRREKIKREAAVEVRFQ